MSVRLSTVSYWCRPAYLSVVQRQWFNMLDIWLCYATRPSAVPFWRRRLLGNMSWNYLRQQRRQHFQGGSYCAIAETLELCVIFLLLCVRYVYKMFVNIHVNCMWCYHANITSCAGGRHNMPHPLQVDLWPWTWCPVTCDVGYLCANFSLPRPLCSRLRPDVRDRQSDIRRASSLNAAT